MCTPMFFIGSMPTVPCALISFALNVPSPKAPHPPHLGGIWIGSTNGIMICDEIKKLTCWGKAALGARALH